MGTFGSFPTAGTDQEFAVFLALFAMELVNRHMRRIPAARNSSRHEVRVSELIMLLDRLFDAPALTPMLWRRSVTAEVWVGPMACDGLGPPLQRERKKEILGRALYFPSSPSGRAPLAASMNAITFAQSFFPGDDSTPLDTSTP